MKVLMFLVAILALSSCFKPYESKTYKYNHAVSMSRLTKAATDSAGDDEWGQAGAMLGMAMIGPVMEEQLGGSYIHPTQFGLIAKITSNGQGEVKNPSSRKDDDRVVIFNDAGDSLVFLYDKENDWFKLDFGDGIGVYFTKDK